MKNEIEKINPEEFGLEKKQASEIEAAFMPKIAEREALKEIYQQLVTKELSPELCKEAKEVRLKLVKVRTGIATIHKTQKAFALAYGRFVDAWKNKETAPVLAMEETLEGIEKHYEKIEAEKIAKLQNDRANELNNYQEEGSFIPDNLGTLEEEVWQNYLLGVKTAWKKKQEEIKIAKEAEEKRIAEEKLNSERKEILLPYIDFVKVKVDLSLLGKMSIEAFTDVVEKAKVEKVEKEKRQEEIRKENEKLKKEAEEKEKARKEAERKQREEHEMKLKAEREKKEHLERKLQEQKEEAERKLKEEEARVQAELNKGDTEKVKDLIAYFETGKTKFSFKSAKNKKMYADVGILIDKIINHINS